MAIWKILADSEYLGLNFADERDIRLTWAYEDGELQEWQPFYVNYITFVTDDTDERYERISNFPRISGFITCDETAKSIIEQSLYSHVDFLPLLSETIKDRRLYVFYATTVLDCLDEEQSENTRLKSGYVVGIQRHVFKSDCIGDVPIFKLPGDPAHAPYVNDRFKQLIEDNNLTGLKFRKVTEW